MPFPPQETVGQAMLERYLALESEIADAENGSPTMKLQHKRKQIEGLEAKIAEQEAVVDRLKSET